MNTVGIDQLTQQHAQETLTKSSIMGKDDFLKMLTMQLKYQDPLNPMSNDQFAAQLAQYSQLETLNNINENIQTEILMAQSMNNSFMVNMIGKDVKSYGNMINLGEGGATIDFELYGDAASIKVKIMDDTGKEVAVVNSNSMRTGDRRVTWDGMTSEGIKAPQGTYYFKVEALSNQGTTIMTEPMSNGVVTGITYQGGAPFLIVNGNYVSLGDIVSVNQVAPSGGG